MYFNYITSVLILAMSFLLGCTRQADPISPNEPEKKSILVPLKKEDDQKLKQIEALDLKTYDSLLLDPATDVKQKVIIPISKIALDPEVLHNKTYWTNPKTREALHILNIGLIKIGQSLANTKGSRSDAFEAYNRLLTEGCSSVIPKGRVEGCKNLLYFSTDQLSSKVAMLMAENQKTVEGFYQLLVIAYALKNRRVDEELSALYLSRATEYISWLEINSEENQDAIYAHKNLLGKIIQLPRSPENTIKLSPYLKSLKPWDADAEKSTLFKENLGDLLELSAKSSLYDDPKTKRHLNKSLIDALFVSQQRPDSFSKHQESLLLNYKSVAKQLGIQKTNIQNEYFYLVDKTFRGQISPQEAETVWRYTNQNSETFKQILLSYIKTEMTQTTISANEEMAKFVNDKEKGKRPTFFYDALVHSRSIAPMVKVFLDNIIDLGELVRRISNHKPGDPELKNLIQSIDSVRRTLKLSLVYPQMLIILYHLGKNDFKMNFDYQFTLTRGGPTDSIIRFFSGERGDPLEYNTDKSPLNRFELLTAFEFGLSTGIFDSFKIDPAEFLEVIAFNLMAPIVSRIMAETARLDKKYEATNAWPELLDTCQSIAKNQSFSANYSLIELQVSPTFGLSFKELTDSNIQNISIPKTSRKLKDQDLGDYPTGAFSPYDGSFRDLIEEIRIYFDPTLSYIKTLQSIYEEYLKTNGEKQDTIGIKIRNLSTRISSLEKIRTEFVQKYSKKNREYADCYFTLVKYDLQMVRNITQWEIQYLKSIYSEMKLLRKEPNNEIEANKKFDLIGLPGGFRGFNHFDGNKFTYHPIDLWLRIKGYFERYEKGIRITVPENFDRMKVFQNTSATLIFFNENENEFIAQGLRAMASTNSNQWFGSTYLNTLSWRDWLYVTATLYRMGEISDPLDAVKIPLELFRLISIQKQDESFFAMTNLGTRFSGSSVSQVLEFQGDQYRGYLDSLHKFLYLDYLGQWGNIEECVEKLNCDPPREFQPLKVAAKDFVKAQQTRKDLFLPLFSQANDRIGVSLKAALKNEERRTNEFEKAALTQYLNDQSQNSTLTLQLRIGEKYNSDYLSSTAINMFQSNLQKFHNQQTFNFFK